MTAHQFPWVFTYIEDARSTEGPFPEKPRFRPAVPILFAGPGGTTDAAALVDSGSNHVLAAPWVAQAIGVDLQGLREYPILIGGAARPTCFTEVELTLPPPEGIDAEPVTWRTDVGFFRKWEPVWPAVLGQNGFLDKFTITLSRMAMILAVEDAEGSTAGMGSSRARPTRPSRDSRPDRCGRRSRCNTTRGKQWPLQSGRRLCPHR